MLLPNTEIEAILVEMLSSVRSRISLLREIERDGLDIDRSMLIAISEEQVVSGILRKIQL